MIYIYMNTAMDAAMKDMISDGVVLSALSGRRQRYRYFGYDNTGLKYTYSISRENIRHTFGDLSSPYSVREITDPADTLIDSIASLSRRAPAAPIRERSRYLDIARSWHSRLLAILDGERFVGYCILDRGNSVSEIEVADERELSGCLRTLFASLGEGYSITLPPDRVGYRRELDMLAEKVTLTTACNFNVLNYRAVIDAFLSLKLSYSTLPDGEMTLLIHGYAGDERVKIVLRDGRALVEYVDRSTPIDCELGHAEALSLIFSPMSAAREQASELARLWFPLPLYIPRADKV